MIPQSNRRIYIRRFAQSSATFQFRSTLRRIYFEIDASPRNNGRREKGLRNGNNRDNTRSGQRRRKMSQRWKNSTIGKTTSIDALRRARTCWFIFNWEVEAGPLRYPETFPFCTGYTLSVGKAGRRADRKKKPDAHREAREMYAVIKPMPLIT